MNRRASLSKAVVESRSFTERTVRRHWRELERPSELLCMMPAHDTTALPRPPEMVRRFFTQLDLRIRSEIAITQMEPSVVACLPPVLAWSDMIDFSVCERTYRREFRQNRNSGNALWNVWRESERYVVETDAYVTKRRDDDTSILSDDIRLGLDHLRLRRCFYRILVGRQIDDRLCLPETELRYLTEQLWVTAHAAAGSMFGLLPEATAIPLSGSMNGAEACLPVIGEEDDRWLNDAANDVVV